YRDRYVAAVRRRHPLARRTTMSVTRFLSFDHILVSPTGGSFEGPTDRALAELDARRTVRYSIPTFLLLPELLQADDLIALVPSRLAREFGQQLVVLRPPIEIPPFDVIAVWHPRAHQDVAHKWFRSRLSETARAQPKV